MNELTKLIYCPKSGYLDGFDGKVYEWTMDPTSAWAMRQHEAAIRIQRVVKVKPDARVVDRRGAKPHQV